MKEDYVREQERIKDSVLDMFLWCLQYHKGKKNLKYFCKMSLVKRSRLSYICGSHWHTGGIWSHGSGWAHTGARIDQRRKTWSRTSCEIHQAWKGSGRTCGTDKWAWAEVASSSLFARQKKVMFYDHRPHIAGQQLSATKPSWLRKSLF